MRSLEMFESSSKRSFGDVLEGSLETAIRFSKQRLSDGEINLRVFDADMSHVRGKQWQPVLNVVALLIPLVKPVNREGMAQVVDARSAAFWFGQLTTHKNFSEVRFDETGAAQAGRGAEEWRL
ncbi:MAG: hypothetical protein KCHDKBKB_02394 [Elusimicrobia bacterium]|nr:hypothetical protein [Elusimicrobiota bacterium]